MKKHVSRPEVISIACIAIAVAYFLSIVLPVFYGPNDKELIGVLCLLFGYFACPSAWLANPGLLVWFILFFNGAYRGAFILASACFAAALTSFFVSEFPDVHTSKTIVGYGSGFYLWHLTFVGSFAISAYMYYRYKTASSVPDDNELKFLAELPSYNSKR